MAKYKILLAGTEIDGKVYDIDAEVDLTDEQAKELEGQVEKIEEVAE